MRYELRFIVSQKTRKREGHGKMREDEPMRIAALYDIHGNIDAFRAVLEDVAGADVDRIVIGGDIAWGPFPDLTVSAIRDLGDTALVIRGNADREVASRAGERDGLQDWVADVNVWCAEQLSDDNLNYLGSLPQTIELDSPMGKTLFCHGTPTSDEGIITPITPIQEASRILGEATQPVVVCGHTHSQFDRDISGTRLVNAGSVGLPYEDEPGAYWALISDKVELRCTRYDFHVAAERIMASGCPHAESFAEAVKSPLPRREAVEHFEKQRRGI